MSSLRNAVKRKAHKERAQPAERRRYGLLEKHKDYVLRARDFHRKEQTLKELRLKASFRNPDEFYFKMQSTRTHRGVHIQPSSGGGKQFTEEELALLRSQDRNYILTKLQAERKKVEKLQASLHGLLKQKAEGEGEVEEGWLPDTEPMSRRQHVVFLDDELEEGTRRGRGREQSERQDGGEEREGPSTSGSDVEHKPEAEDGLRATSNTSNKRAAAAYRELEMRKERVQRLSAILQQMELQQNLAGKGRKRKIVEVSEAGEKGTTYKWAKQRQR